MNYEPVTASAICALVHSFAWYRLNIEPARVGIWFEAGTGTVRIVVPHCASPERCEDVRAVVAEHLPITLCVQLERMPL